MLSSRTIKFLTAAILIAVAVLATISMVSPVVEKSVSASNADSRAQYHQSERAEQTAEMGLAQYHRSERSSYDPQAAGQAIYFNSERSFPIRDLGAFNTYQRSEWFGQ
jgi:hypothetical protein